MFKRLRDFVTLYTSLVRDPRTPKRAKYLPWLALAYLVFPLDIIPDLLPILGQADDLTVIIMLISLAVSAISDAQYEEHKRKKRANAIDAKLAD